jgi:hypothetical protein
MGSLQTSAGRPTYIFKRASDSLRIVVYRTVLQFTGPVFFPMVTSREALKIPCL